MIEIAHTLSLLKKRGKKERKEKNGTFSNSGFLRFEFAMQPSAESSLSCQVALFGLTA